MNYVYTQNDTLLHYYTCGNLMSRDSFLHVRRTMDCHVLILVLKGCLPITVSGVPHLVKAGEFIFLKAGEEHYATLPLKEVCLISGYTFPLIIPGTLMPPRLL